MHACINTYIHTYVPTYIHTHTWSVSNSKTVINYFIAKRKLSELVLDVRVYNGSDIGSDHVLTLDKLRFSPKWLVLPRDTALKENILHYGIRLLIDGSIRSVQIMQQNYKKFQKVAILFWNGKTKKNTYSHTQQIKVWENTKGLHRKKLKLWDSRRHLLV